MELRRSSLSGRASGRAYGLAYGLASGRIAAALAAAALTLSIAGCTSATVTSPSAGSASSSPAASALVTPAPSTDADVLGLQLVDRFFAILAEPPVARSADLDGLLAPEFQVVRANGDTQTRAAYLASSPSVFTYTVSNLLGTLSGNSLVVSYQVSTTETVSGVGQETTAPRLSVFRLVDGSWHLVAHSNFGALR